MPRHPRIAALLALVASLAACGTAAAQAADPDSPAAVVDSIAIPRSAIEASVRPQLEQAQRDHDSEVRRSDLRLALARDKIVDTAVQRVLNDRVLSLESARAHSSPAQLLAKVKVAPVSDADVRGFYAERQRQIGKPFEQVAKQIRDYLEKQAKSEAEGAYLAGLRAKYHSESRLEPLRFAVDADGPSRGPAAAAVTVVEFADFQCPYCRDMESVIGELRAAYPSDVRFVFRHLPLVSLHPLALAAARGSVCADRQGHFWEMHDALFADQSALGEDALKAAARRIGLDGDTFDQCLEKGAPETKVVADATVADALGLSSTPVFFVNGRLITGTAPASAFRMVIDDELARRRHGGAAGVGHSAP